MADVSARDPGHLARYDALVSISKTLADHETVAELFQVLAHHLHAVVPFDALALVLHDNKADEMRLVVLEPADIVPTLLTVPFADHGPAAMVWETQKGAVVTIPDAGPVPPSIAYIHNLGQKVACLLPLTTARQKIGVLAFGSRSTSAYSDDALAFMEQTVSAGYTHEMPTAPAGSDLAQSNGRPDAKHQEIWVTGAQPLGVMSVRGRVGQERTMAGDRTAYAIGADLAAVDRVKLSVERNSGDRVVSPRTIGLGLTQESHRAQLDWSPTFSSELVVDASYQTLSDGNHRWELTVSPRHSVARMERLNLDLGGQVSLLHTTTNFNNGSYDPNRYQYLRRHC